MTATAEQTVSITVPRPVFDMHFACVKTAARYTCSGVLIQRKAGKCEAVATDGCMLALMRWDDDTDKPDMSVIVEASDLKRVKVPRKLDGARLDVEGLALEIKTDDTAMRCRAVDQDDYKFPPYGDVIPTYADGDADNGAPSIGISPILLGSTMAWMGKHLHSEHRGVWWRHQAANKPVIVKARAEAGEMMAVIMPVSLA